GARGGRSRPRPAAALGRMARGYDALRVGRGDSRRRRALARSGRPDADPRPLVRARQSAASVRGALCGVRVTRGGTSAYLWPTDPLSSRAERGGTMAGRAALEVTRRE